MNELANELIKEIVLLGEAEKKPPKKNPTAKKEKDKKPSNAKYQSGGKWYSDSAFTNYVGRMERGKWVPATPEEKATERGKEPARAVRQPTSPSASQPQVSGQQPTIPPISPAAGKVEKMENIHRSILDLLPRAAAGDKEAIKKLEKLIKDNKIQFDTKKNQFIVSSLTGRQNREARRLFGSGRSEMQSALHKYMTTVLQIDIPNRDSSTDPLKPQGTVPEERKIPFSGQCEDGIDSRGVCKSGRIAIGDRVFTRIDDIKSYVSTEVERWKENYRKQNGGKEPSIDETNAVTRNITVLAAVQNRRFMVLEKLLRRSKANPTPHNVAIYEGQAGASEYIQSIRERLLEAARDNTTLQTTVNDALDAVESANNTDDTIAALNKLSEILLTNEEFRTSYSSVAESLSIILELKRYRQVIIPMAENFTTCDLVSISTEDVDLTTLSLEEQTARINLLYTDVSVKGEASGAASATLAKWKMCVFEPDHAQTMADINTLYNSTLVDIWSGKSDRRSAKEREIMDVVTRNFELIKKYYGFGDDVKTPEDLLKKLGNGRPRCKNGEVVESDVRSFMTEPDVDVDAYAYVHLAQLAGEAIGNSRVIGQSFGNHFWGKSGFREVDGIARLTKIETEFDKGHVGRGKNKHPEYLSSHNIEVSSEEELRSGNPCRKSAKGKQ